MTKQPKKRPRHMRQQSHGRGTTGASLVVSERTPGTEVKIPEALLEAIETGRCVLFLGTGASQDAEAPRWSRLVEDGAVKFCPHQAERVAKYFARSDPWGAADLVFMNAPRPDVDVFVRNRLERLAPSDAHLQLTDIHWAAIFTTNYDTLIEAAYAEKEQSRAQTPTPVYQFSKDYNLHDNGKVHIFKLHGSIDQIHQAGNILVLTTKDVADSARARATMLAQIPRLLLDYYWLFVGYSFSDGIVRQLLAEVKRANRDRMPRQSFAVLPMAREEDNELFDQYDIAVVGATFGAFMDAINDRLKTLSAGRLRARRVKGTVVSGGVTMSFVDTTRVAMDDQFEFVQPADHDANASAFMLGNEPTWGNIAAGVDFRRNALVDHVIAQVRQATGQAPMQAVVVTGAAGSGKSTLIRRVGYELAVRAENPLPAVLLRDFATTGNRYADAWDVRLIEEVSYAADGKPVLILVDNVEVYYRMVRNLYSALRNRDLPAVILGAARSLDWSNLIDDYPMPGFTAIAVPDEIETAEVPDFVEYLSIHRLITIDNITTDDYWRHQISRRHEKHLLGVMRSINARTQEEFDEKIVTEYINLPASARQAYEMICLSYQFGFPVHIDLLLDLLSLSEPEFAEQVLKRDKDHVIICTADTFSGKKAYKARHRIIAEIVAGHRWKERHETCEALVVLIESMNPQAEEDYRLCKQILMSDSVRDRLDGISYVRRLFDTALEVFGEDHVFYQHYAKAEMEARPGPDFQKAHDLLNAAQHAPGAEANPTIQHSRGMLYLHEAGYSRDPAKKKLYEGKAEDEFIKYRKLDRQSEYGYYTHARMLARQREGLVQSDHSDSREGDRLLARALQVVCEGLAEVDIADQNKLPLLHADLLSNLDPARAIRQLDEWISLSPTPEAYYLSGTIRLTQNDLTGAEKCVTEGLSVAPDHRGLLALKVDILKRQGGYDNQALLTALKAAMLAAPELLNFAFEAAVTAYHLDELQQASQYFARAYKLAGRAGRFRAYLVRMDRSAGQLHEKIAALAKKWGAKQAVPTFSEPDLAVVSGVVQKSGEKSFYLLRDGHGDRLAVIRDYVDRDCLVPDLRVECNVAFNYRGPVAINLRRRGR